MLVQEKTRLQNQGSHSVNLVGQEARGIKIKAKRFTKRKKPAEVSQTNKKE